MSRRLVHGTQRANTATPNRSRDDASQSALVLPPYEAPRYAMSEKYQRELNDISSTGHDFSKYSKHIKAALLSLTNCTVEGYDQIHLAREDAARLTKRRERAQDEKGEVIEVSEAELDAEKRAEELQQKVEELAKEAEKSLRELIDYGDELAQQSHILKAVQEDVAINSREAPAINRGPARKATPENDDSDADEEGEDADLEVEEQPAVPFDVLSATETLQKAKTDYTTSYAQQSMLKRYATHKDYVEYKRAVHDAMNPVNAPPVPHHSTWFPAEDRTAKVNTADAKRRRAMVDEAKVEALSDSDDDLEIAAEVQSLKCPLTLQILKEPFSNTTCPHTFEKYAITEYYNENARAEVQATGRRRAEPVGPKTITCPVPGCVARLDIKDFFDDQILLRKVKRMQAAAARENDETMVDGDEDAEIDAEEFGDVDA